MLNVNTDTRTVIIKKADKRMTDGVRDVKQADVILREDQLELALEIIQTKYPTSKGYRVMIVDTYVEKTSFMDPTKKFWERFDTPYYCSASSETYWSS